MDGLPRMAFGKDRTVTKYLMTLLVVAATLLSAAGCASQATQDELRALYRKSQEQVEYLKAQLDEANARIAALTLAGEAPDPALLAELESALSERDAALAALADAETALRQLGRMGGPILDPETDAALMQLAQAHPELMSYDPDLGMVRFQSDLTFALGSVEVQPNAVASLKGLAQILNGSTATGYEVRIIGHTDNVPVSRPATKAKHPTNWHLSAHRAIAVKDVLLAAQVAPKRLLVAGAGEYRPIAPNTKTGNQANRRVEIYLVAMPTAPATAATASAPPAAPPKASAAPVTTTPTASPANSRVGVTEVPATESAVPAEKPTRSEPDFMK